MFVLGALLVGARVAQGCYSGTLWAVARVAGGGGQLVAVGVLTLDWHRRGVGWGHIHGAI